MRNIRRLLKLSGPYRVQIAIALVLLVAVVGVDLVLPRLIQRIVDEGVVPGDMGTIVQTALLMLGFAILNALMMIGNTILAARVAQYFAADLRSALFRKVQSFSYGNLDQMQTGQLMVRLTSDVNTVQMLLLMTLRIGTRAPLLMLGSGMLLVVTSPRLAAMVSVFLPVIGLILWFFIRRAQPMFLKVQEKLDRLNQVLQENLAGARLVKAFARAPFENDRFATANDDLMGQTIKVRRLLSVVPPTMILLINLGAVAVIWLGGVQAMAGDLSIGQIMAFMNYLLTTMFPLLMLAMLAVFLSQARASAERIVGVLDSEPEVRNLPGARPLETAFGRVVFEDVHFAYNHGLQEEVLSGINLVAEPGQTVAILGATGSGKSSLINLIPRFYDVDAGRVTMDGLDVRDMTQETLRAQIGIAPQRAVLFSVSIRDNIRYGRPDAADEEVTAAAKAAQAHEFISEMPDGYDTLVDQGGTNLSGGQKQRVAIARALLTRPAVLILDDSTSAVDVETEVEIQEALEEWMRDRTTFIIAQRISTVLTADKIVVLDDGRIAAEGTHHELLAASPIYREIFESQLQDGRNDHG